MPLTTVVAFILVVLTLPVPLAAQGALGESLQADRQLPVQDVETAETEWCAALPHLRPEQSRACSQFHLAPSAAIGLVPEAESKSEPTPRSDPMSTRRSSRTTGYASYSRPAWRSVPLRGDSSTHTPRLPITASASRTRDS